MSPVLALFVLLCSVVGYGEYDRRARSVPHLPSPPFVSYRGARDWRSDDRVSLRAVVDMMRKEIRVRGDACMLAPDVNVDLRVAVLDDGSALINPELMATFGATRLVVRDVNGMPVEALVHEKVEYEYLGEFLEPARANFSRAKAECLQILLSET